jgi:hypothetical protein
LAHETQITGKLSELTAAKALMSVGWEVAEPTVPEVYDLVGRDPLNGKFARFQVKTVRNREDRGSLVIYARKGNGEPYSPEDVDYILGVHGDKVYLTECTGQAEYWSVEATASKRWVELTGSVEESA